jgi:hypothetical protein
MMDDRFGTSATSRAMPYANSGDTLPVREVYSIVALGFLQEAAVT